MISWHLGHSRRAAVVALLAALVIALPALATTALAGTEVTLFEKTYTRVSGPPILHEETLAAVQGTALLVVTHSGVSSAFVKVNGVAVFAPKDFNSHPGTLEATIQVETTNVLLVQLRGAPGETLSVRVTQIQELQPTIYYTSYDGQQLRRIDSDGSDVWIAGPPFGTCYSPVLSNAGSEVALMCSTNGWDSQVWVMSVAGTGAYKLADAMWGSHISWQSADTEIAYDVNVEGIHRVATSGGAGPLWIPTSQFAPFGKNSFRWPGIRWSSDRTRFAANVGVASAGGNEAFVGNIDFATGALTNIRRISPSSGSSWSATVASVAITGDGETVFYGWRDFPAGVLELRRVGFDGSSPQTIWSAPVDPASGIGNMRLSPDGERLWFAPCATGGCKIASVNLDGSDYREVATAAISGWFDLK